jgi:hypothetical protein
MGARYAPAIGLLIVGIVIAGCGSAEPTRAKAPATEKTATIRSEALRIELPPGWYGDARTPKIPSAPLVRAATFPLAVEHTGLGRQARRTMGEGDILITVADYGPMPGADEPPTPLPVAVDGSHVTSFEGFREPVVVRTITVSSHRLQLWVVFGSSDPSDERYAEANRVLETLAVQPRMLGLGGLTVELKEGWDGFAKDIGPPHEQVPALYVANVPWPDRGQNFADAVTLEPFEALPPEGVVIAASASSSGGEEFRHVLRRPVTLSDGHFLADSYEGQPAPHVSTQIISGRLGEQSLSIHVYFGRNDPTDEMRAEANHVLATLEITAASERR